MTIFNLCAVLTMLLGFGCTAEHTNPNNLNIRESNKDINIFNGKMMRSYDQGKMWEDCSVGLPPNLDIQSVLATDEGLYLGSVNSDLYLNSNAPKSTWLTENLKDAFVYTSDTKGYAVTGIFESSNAYFANVIYDALYKKNKTTKRWQPIKLPIGLNVVSDVVEDTNDNIYIAGQYGIYVSDNNGVNWKHIYKQGWAQDIIILNNRIIISGKGGLYSSDDEGQTWKNLNLSKPNMNLLISPEEHSYTIFMLGNQLAALRSDFPNRNAGNGKLQISSDGGTTWQNHKADKALQTLEGVSAILLQNNILYCSHKNGINTSADNGNTWQTILQHIDNQINNNTTLQLYQIKNVFYVVEQNLGC